MLWIKNWMETRWRVLSAIGLFCIVSVLFSLRVPEGPGNAPVAPETRFAFFLTTFALFFMMQAVILGGAGIKTQAPFRTSRGLHGSMHFTLSLPVSRLRIMATRVLLGVVEMFAVISIGCILVWFLFIPKFPELHITLSDLGAHLVTTFAVIAVCFFLATLLSTFLDDLWQAWGTFLLLGLVRAVSSLVPIPKSIDPFLSVSTSSPLLTHSIPWPAVSMAVGVSGVLLFASMKLVQNRDY